MKFNRLVTLFISILLSGATALAKVDVLIITDLGGHESTAAGIEYDL
jgi:hypothetical protein